MAPLSNMKTMAPARARKSAHKRNTMSRLPSRLPKAPSGEENIEASMRKATTKTTMRKTKKWRPPTRISWPRGTRKVMVNTGAMTYRRGRNKINAIAISKATSTTGCRMVSEAPPPNRRFSGCISKPPTENTRSRGTHFDGGSQLRGAQRLALRHFDKKFFQQAGAALPAKPFDEFIGRISQTNPEIVIAEKMADISG